MARDNTLLKSVWEIHGANYGKTRVIFVRFVCTDSSQEIDFLSPVIRMRSFFWHREGTILMGNLYSAFRRKGTSQEPFLDGLFFKAFNSK